VRPFAHSGLVYEDDGSAFSRAVFFSAGQRLVFQRRIAVSSRWMARPLGRWQEKFRLLSRRHTPDSEYLMPLSSSISLPSTTIRRQRTSRRAARTEPRRPADQRSEHCSGSASGSEM
jgi:hypothetical protein